MEELFELLFGEHGVDDLDGKGIIATTYDWRNLPLSITVTNPVYPFTPIAHTYRYDHNGHRVYSSVDQTYTVRGAYGEPIAEYGGTTPALRYWNNVRPDGVVIGRQPISGNPLYYHRDHLGSTRTVVNSSGSVVETYDYMPFGEFMSGRILTSGTGTRPKFTGHAFDDETNLHTMQWRRQIPRYGVFRTPDPLADEYPGWNPYAYVMNDPNIHVDPDGQFIGTIIGAIFGGVTAKLKGESIWAGIAAGALAGAMIDLTIASGGSLGVVAGGFALAGMGGYSADLALRDERVEMEELMKQGFVGVLGGGGAYVMVGRLAPVGVVAARETANRVGAGRLKQVIERNVPGSDGGASKHILEKINGVTNSVTHQVQKNGKVIHQHQTHIGKYGSQRQFPDKWVEYPKIPKSRQ